MAPQLAATEWASRYAARLSHATGCQTGNPVIAALRLG